MSMKIKNQVYLNFWDEPYFNEMILFRTGEIFKTLKKSKYVNVTINALKIIFINGLYSKTLLLNKI